MGKRKERRLAALSNAGRRVKLDLFAEPSGDLGGSSVQEEVGGDSDPTQLTGLPNSPSSSGPQPQNPLQLLGQYSDDELDEESSKMPNHDRADDVKTGPNDQDGPICEEKDTDAKEVEDIVSQKNEQVGLERGSNVADVSTSLEGIGIDENDATASADTCKEVDPVEELPVAGISGAQIIGDVSFGWKLVMHEESNQYYYWNTETGETSWEVPAVLAQSIQLSSDQKSLATDSVETFPVSANESGGLGFGLDNSSARLTADGSTTADLIPQHLEGNGNQQMDGLVEGYKTDLLEDKNCATNANHGELGNNLNAANDFPDHGNLAVSANIHDEVVCDEHQRGLDLSTKLMKQCDCLLERMRSLKGYEGHLQCPNQMWKYILEVETRLSDIKSLSSYGSSLFPFWAHSEKRLIQLEDAINNEIYQLAVSAQMDDIICGSNDSSLKEKENSQESMGHELEPERYNNSRETEYSPVSTHVENSPQNEAPQGTITSLGSPAIPVENEATLKEELNVSTYVKPELHDVEDVDMDVDMEVEDEVPAASISTGNLSSNKDFTITEQLMQVNAHTDYSTITPADASTVPPPPEEEWIPPPPPDNDQIPPPPPDYDQVPPPPPDDPPESSYPPHPSYTESQPFPYSGQYNLTYTDSNYQYYGATVPIPSGNFYEQTDGSQVALPHVPIYYEAIPNTYSDTASVVVNPVEPVVYYNLQDGSVPPVPVSSVESSHLHTESGDNIMFGQSRIVNEAEGKPEVSVVNNEPDSALMGVSSNSATTQTPATDVKESASTSSTNAVNVAATAPAPSVAAKVQSKVLRSKKRTIALAPSLRSNKKVSSLVDKWKAAKEEMNENEEDEPENPYEILEKKRQREIEEWRAKQIASGEAKDNANFQPLGGDWRERVKRKRAQAAKVAARTSPEAPADKNQVPDLVELAKGLPSGWQVYWDESSKQVYYGNLVTSETTWTKPTK